ncbi:MAG: S-layer homology domain-containing protein [Cyanobacteria bacterium]|nr:S-layer homology domain-containing protein [Cyanobacteriota bacterium]
MTNKRFGLVICALSFIWANLALKVEAASKGYYDVPKSHWASGAVKELVDDYQFMSGDPNGNFGGTRALSRYEFAKTISKMTDYYNQEIESDRKDLENIVGVMELFQSELKNLQGKAAQANSEVESQNATIAELNELVITVAEELANIDAEPGKMDEINQRIALAESKIHKLDNKGLLVGTLVKGVFNDVKSIGRGVNHVTSSARSSRLRRKKRLQAQSQATTLEDELVEEAATLPVALPQVGGTATLETHSSITGQQAAIAAPLSEIEQLQQDFDGLYADESYPNENFSEVEYLEPIGE